MKIHKFLMLILVVTISGCAGTPNTKQEDVDAFKHFVKKHLSNGGDPNYAYDGVYTQFIWTDSADNPTFTYRKYIGFTLLQKAVSIDDLNTAEVLLESGADPNYVVPHKQTTPVSMQTYAKVQGTAVFYARSREMVELLVNHGADVNYMATANDKQFKWQVTPILFHIIANSRFTSPGAYSALLEAGANAGVIYKNEYSEFHEMTAGDIAKEKKENFKEIILAKTGKTAEGSRLEAYDKVIAILYDYELKPLFVSSCEVFSYNKCKSFIKKGGDEVPLIKRAKQIVKDYEKNEAVVLFNNLCGYEGNLAGCKIFLNNHEGLYHESVQQFVLNYHSKSSIYQSIQASKSPESEYKRAQYCYSDPFDYSELEDLFEFANDGCRTQIKGFSDSVREYLKDGDTGEAYWIEDEYKDSMRCIREKRHKVVKYAREYYESDLSRVNYECKQNEPAFKYASQLKSNINRADQAMEDLPKLSRQINRIMKRYEKQKNRPAKVQKSWIGELASAMAEIDSGNTSMIEFTPGLSKSDQMFLDNQRKLKDIAQGKDPSSGSYGAGGNSMSSSSGSNGGAGGKQEKSEQYEFTCPNPPNAKPQSIELPYYTTSCLAVLKRFYITHACNLIDDMPKVEQDCTQACGRPDCMESP
jgi:hypothetical protein